MSYQCLRSKGVNAEKGVSEKKTIKLARNLEMFRVAIAVTTNIRSMESSIPTNIYIFRNGKDYAEAGGIQDSAGFFMPGLRANSMVMRNSNMAETKADDSSQEQGAVLSTPPNQLN